MSNDLTITERHKPSHGDAPAEKRPSKPRRVTGALKDALDAIVFEGAEMDAAARRANITTRAVRLAMEKPHVLAYVRAQRALLTSEVHASNVHHLKKLRSDSPNQLARLGAVREIENIVEGRRSNGVAVNVNVDVRAGYVMDLRETE